MVAGVRDSLVVVGAEFSSLVCAILCKFSAAVFTASLASWDRLCKVFNAQELVT